MKNPRQFRIDHNPAASNNVTPYHVGETIDGRVCWIKQAFSTLDSAGLFIRSIDPNAVISHN